MSVVFALNLAGCILSFVFYDNLEQAALDSMSKYNETGTPESQDIAAAWNKLQISVSEFYDFS